MKAIKTIYNGIKFRSKLEARWAVFFDHFGLSYEYEPESFLLEDGLVYCPDFYLSDLDCYAEVKPLLKMKEEGYNEFKFDSCTFYLKPSEYEKIQKFDYKIVLLVGMPTELCFMLFNSMIHYDGFNCYPNYDRDPITKEPFWRWWWSSYATDYPKRPDIQSSADYAKYYDFFKF